LMRSNLPEPASRGRKEERKSLGLFPTPGRKKKKKNSFVGHPVVRERREGGRKREWEEKFLLHLLFFPYGEKGGRKKEGKKR